ncbi:endonuclease/exonuclease/phosphatase family protein [Alteraurantiacibacter aquimixticola]
MRLRSTDGGERLDGAREGDWRPGGEGETPALDRMDRVLTARVLAELDADVVALQEVFDQATLDHFHDNFLLAENLRPWPHRICLPGNDGRGFDVALMSREAPRDIRSHAELTCGELGLEPQPGHGPDERIFRRDCLVATVGGITLYVCHFKAPYPDAERSWFLRRREAQAVRMLVERYSAGEDNPLWLVLGDLNEPDGGEGDEEAIAPLTDPTFSVDLLGRLKGEERWSFRDPGSGAYSHPDAMLASPALAARYATAKPFYLRCGLERDIARYEGRHLPGVGEHRPHASDHAVLAIDLHDD